VVSHLYKTKTNTRFLRKIQDFSKKRKLTTIKKKRQFNEHRIKGRHTFEICGIFLVKQAGAYHVNAHPIPQLFAWHHDWQINPLSLQQPVTGLNIFLQHIETIQSFEKIKIHTFTGLGSINSWAKWWTANGHVALNITIWRAVENYTHFSETKNKLGNNCWNKIYLCSKEIRRKELLNRKKS